MSIASEISALTTDRNNIRAALVAKGIAAASASGFDSFADLIASIPTGSGPVPTGVLAIDVWNDDPADLIAAGVPMVSDGEGGWHIDWGGQWNLSQYQYFYFVNNPVDYCEGHWEDDGYGSYEECKCASWDWENNCGSSDPCESRESCESQGGVWDDETGCSLCQEEPEE